MHKHLMDASVIEPQLILPWVTGTLLSPAKAIYLGDDHLTADSFIRSASAGHAAVWGGDFQNAKNLLAAVKRRIDSRQKKSLIEFKKTKPSAKELFLKYRHQRSQRAQLLSKLLIRITANNQVLLKRAPETQEALSKTLGNAMPAEYLISLNELLGILSAYEWQTKGLYLEEINAKIFPYYGVYSPTRSEYLKLIKDEAWSGRLDLAYDIGIGSGVISILLAQKGFRHIVGTDTDPRAIQCANWNVNHLNLNNVITIQQQSLIPDAPADLIICNPPWLPLKPTSPVEKAVYDPDHAMLKSFLKLLPSRLRPGGEGWLILSNLAEILGLRQPGELEDWIEQSGLKLVSQKSTQPVHKRSKNEEDPMFEFRAQEVTSLFRLTKSE